jgi:hypothetical protein
MSGLASDIAAADQAAMADPAIARMEGRLGVLEEVGAIGLDILRALHDEAKADRTLLPAAATAYVGISRAIRLTLMLQMRTEEALHALRAGLFAQLVQAKAPASAEPGRAPQIRVEADRESDRDCERESPDREARDVLEGSAVLDALEARLALYEEEAQAQEADAAPAPATLAGGPRSQIVARLCADLKLTPARRSSLWEPSRAPLLMPANADPGPRPLRHPRE